MVDIRILVDGEDLKQFRIADGFMEYLNLSGSITQDVYQFLKSQLGSGNIFIAIEANKIVGFAIIKDWETIPESKRLEIIEVAKPFRGRGIGSFLMKQIIKEINTMIILIAISPAPEYQDKLVNFYKNFGFEELETFTNETVMARIPKDRQKLIFWKKIIENKLSEYSYGDFSVTKLMPTWGRRYAPWLRADVYMLRPLLERIKFNLN
ncbi:MAG: GNAT family N-acetyltransferase [Candidatus Methanosuratincola petrocarbonis]